MANPLFTRRDALRIFTPKVFSLPLGGVTFTCNIIGRDIFIRQVEQQLKQLAHKSHYARLLLEALSRLPAAIDIVSGDRPSTVMYLSAKATIAIEHNACVGNSNLAKSCKNGAIGVLKKESAAFDYNDRIDVEDNYIPSIIVLAHELFHAGWHQNRNFYQQFEAYYRSRSAQEKQLEGLYFPKDTVDEMEIVATKYTNLIRLDLGIDRIRSYYHYADKDKLDTMETVTNRHKSP